ncbi:SLATT domain-containing protein [Delftia tsuruhatensis]|uniref:SLATT domain-containing protein n=1 Tax=Delftia tsuruhatensis TaxID=180282 RepID=UPI00338D5A15
MSQQFNDIWFTFKARIAAELRLKNNDVHSQILLIWYAIASSIVAIVSLKYKDPLGQDTDLYTTILSVALLSLSLLVATRDYRGRALSMRSNHITLKLLYDDLMAGNLTPAEKPKLYSKLLLECENHSSYDDRYFRLFAQTTRPLSIQEFFIVFFQIAARWLFIATLYFSPIALIIIKLHQKGA